VTLISDPEVDHPSEGIVVWGPPPWPGLRAMYPARVTRTTDASVMLCVRHTADLVVLKDVSTFSHAVEEIPLP
jgi:hypothetical protein